MTLHIDSRTPLDQGIEIILHHANMKYPNQEDSNSHQSLIDSSVHEFVTKALRDQQGYLHATHLPEYYFEIIEHAFESYPNEISMHGYHSIKDYSIISLDIERFQNEIFV